MTAPLHPPCDRSIAAARPEAATASPPHAGWILATTILASSLAFIDGSVVNVGLPAIGSSVGDSRIELAWVLNGYLLPLSALLMIGGAAGDLYGRRRLLVIGTVLFAAASLLCALAPGMVWLVAGRVLQGIGAALLMPNSLAILGASFSGEARGRAIGIWAAVGAAAGAVAPLLGGWMIDAIGWRSIFLINLPIAAAAIALALRYVPNEPEQGQAPLDLAGGLIGAGALGALTWGLTRWSATQHAGGLTLAVLGAGLVALGVFVLVERRRGDQAMLPLSLFRSADFVGLSLLTLLLYGALGGLLVLVPYLLIQAHGYSATAAGAALLPLPVVIALSSSAMGRLAARTGARLPLIIGPLVVAAGCLLALRIEHAGSYGLTVFPALLLISLGMAGAVAPLTTAVLASARAEHTGVASGFNSAIARTGGLIATALLGGVLALQGDALAASFRWSAVVAAAVAFAASASAFIWVGRNPSKTA
jgi:EmrB/QacA subfamily drug resistance transporter